MVCCELRSWTSPERRGARWCPRPAASSGSHLPSRHDFVSVWRVFIIDFILDMQHLFLLLCLLWNINIKLWNYPLKVRFWRSSKVNKEQCVFVPVCGTYAVFQQWVYGSRLVHNSELDSCHHCAASQRRTWEGAGGDISKHSESIRPKHKHFPHTSYQRWVCLVD